MEAGILDHSAFERFDLAADLPVFLLFHRKHAGKRLGSRQVHCLLSSRRHPAHRARFRGLLHIRPDAPAAPLLSEHVHVLRLCRPVPRAAGASVFLHSDQGEMAGRRSPETGWCSSCPSSPSSVSSYSAGRILPRSCAGAGRGAYPTSSPSKRRQKRRPPARRKPPQETTATNAASAEGRIPITPSWNSVTAPCAAVTTVSVPTTSTATFISPNDLPDAERRQHDAAGVFLSVLTLLAFRLR